MKKLMFLMLVLMSVNAFAQIRMSGCVYDDKIRLHPLVGALITLENTNIVTMTDAEGLYVITAPEKYLNHNVLISFAGYITDTIPMRNTIRDVSLNMKESQRIGAVFVSTQKKAQLEIDVPIALSVFDSKKQDAFNCNQIDEMSRMIPGFISLTKGSDFGVFGIRGVATDGVYSYEKIRISVYQDGVPINRARESVLELFDLQRVEVAKGPQGTLFGRSSEFGAVHYISNTPQKEFGFSALIGAGNYGQRTAEAVVNAPLSEKVANRTAIRYDAHDGYIDDAGGGRLNGKNTLAFKNSTAFFFNPSSTMHLNLVYQHDDEPALSYKSKRIAPPIEGGSTSPFETAWFTGGPGQEIKRDVYGVSLDYDKDFSDNFSFSNVAAFRGFKSKNGFDLDGTYLNLVNTRYQCDGYSISEEARFNWDNGKRLSGFFGAGLYYDKLNVNSNHYGDAKIFSGLILGASIKERLKNYPQAIGDGVNAAIEQYLRAVIKQQNYETTNPEAVLALNNILPSLQMILGNQIKARLTKRMDEWFSQPYWDQSPDILNGTVEEVQIAVREILADVEQNNEYGLKEYFELLGGTEPLEGMIGPMLTQQLSQNDANNVANISNVPIPPELQENETRYNNMYEGDVFADFTWQLSPKFYLTLGARGTYENQESGYSSTSDRIPIVGNMLFWPSENGETVTTSQDYLSWSGRAILNCKVDSTHNLFFSVSKGRSAAELYFAQRPDSIVSLAPEQIYNYEIGFKGISKYGHFYYYTAFYYYDWRNFQSSVSQSTANGSRLLRSSDKGKARGFGFDGQLLYTFTDNFSTFLDLAFVNGKFSKKDTDGNDQALAGKKFVMMPEATVDFGYNHQIPVSRNKFIHFHPMMSYMSKTYFTTENEEHLSQKGFWIANANLAYSWKSRKDAVNYEIGIYGKNLFDTQYLISAGNGGSWFGFPTYVAGAPLTFGVVFRVGMQ